MTKTVAAAAADPKEGDPRIQVDWQTMGGNERSSCQKKTKNKNWNKEM